MREIIIDIAAAVLTGLAVVVLNHCKIYLQAKLKNEAVDAAMTRLTNTTQTVVDNLAQVVVSDLKASGMFGPKAAGVAKKQAFESIIRQSAPSTLKTVESAVGALPVFIHQKIEQAVLRGKK